MLIKKFSKLYTLLCLCGDTSKYKNILDATLIAEENELLREGFMDSLRNIKELYNSKKLVLNRKVLEKVKYYL